MQRSLLSCLGVFAFSVVLFGLHDTTLSSYLRSAVCCHRAALGGVLQSHHLFQRSAKQRRKQLRARSCVWELEWSTPCWDAELSFCLLTTRSYRFCLFIHLFLSYLLHHLLPFISLCSFNSWIVSGPVIANLFYDSTLWPFVCDKCKITYLCCKKVDVRNTEARSFLLNHLRYVRFVHVGDNGCKIHL